LSQLQAIKLCLDLGTLSLLVNQLILQPLDLIISQSVLLDLTLANLVVLVDHLFASGEALIKFGIFFRQLIKLCFEKFLLLIERFYGVIFEVMLDLPGF